MYLETSNYSPEKLSSIHKCKIIADPHSLTKKVKCIKRMYAVDNFGSHEWGITVEFENIWFLNIFLFSTLKFAFNVKIKRIILV